MEPSTIQNTINPMTPDNLKTPPQDVEKPKKRKVAVWILSILFVIAAAAAGVFAYLYFSNTAQNSPQSEGDNSGSSSTADTPSEEEVEITDALTIQDLDNKIAILHYTNTTGKTIKKEEGPVVYSYLPKLYSSGDFESLATRVTIVINSSLRDQFHTLSTEELTSIDGDTFDNTGISGDIVVAKYKDVFGEDLDLSSYSSTYKMPFYFYDDTYDFFYLPPAYGGGYLPFTQYYYKNKYTTSGDYAYVYISTAFWDAEDGKVYCDIAYLDLENPDAMDDAEVCAVLQTEDEKKNFTIDSSNYEQYAEYRFVFKKADNGTYYFEKVEKV